MENYFSYEIMKPLKNYRVKIILKYLKFFILIYSLVFFLISCSFHSLATASNKHNAAFNHSNISDFNLKKKSSHRKVKDISKYSNMKGDSFKITRNVKTKKSLTICKVRPEPSSKITYAKLKSSTLMEKTKKKDRDNLIKESMEKSGNVKKYGLIKNSNLAARKKNLRKNIKLAQIKVMDISESKEEELSPM